MRQERNPFFSPAAMQYVARFNPPRGEHYDLYRRSDVQRHARVPSYMPRPVSSVSGNPYTFADPEPNPWVPGGGITVDGRYMPGSGRFHTRRTGGYQHGGGRRYDGAYYPGGGYYPQGNPYTFADPEPNPWHPGGGIKLDGTYMPGGGRQHRHRGSAYRHGGGRRYDGAYYPGGGYYPQANNPTDAYGNWYELDRRVYGNPSCREEYMGSIKGYGLRCTHSNPSHYPSPLARQVAEEIARTDGSEGEIWDAVDSVLRHRMTLAGSALENPMVRGRHVPEAYSKGGAYHHVRFAHPDEYDAIRTKTLSERKGLKARFGITERESEFGPRGGNTEMQSMLFDAQQYTPDDVVRWLESHETPDPLLMDISPKKATKRRMAIGPKKPAKPRKKRAKRKKKVAARKKRAKDVKAGKRKPARSTPPAAKRCTAKTQGGKARCKGWRMEGSKQCSLHAQGLARKPKKKKSTKKKRKAG